MRYIRLCYGLVDRQIYLCKDSHSTIVGSGISSASPSHHAMLFLLRALGACRFSERFRCSGRRRARRAIKIRFFNPCLVFHHPSFYTFKILKQNKAYTLPSSNRQNFCVPVAYRVSACRLGIQSPPTEHQHPIYGTTTNLAELSINTKIIMVVRSQLWPFIWPITTPLSPIPTLVVH